MRKKLCKFLIAAMIAAAGLVMTIGTPAIGFAQRQSFDGGYKGTLECEQTTPDLGVLRATLTMTVRNRSVVAAAAPMYDIDGKLDPMVMIATGRVDTDGVVRVGHTDHMPDITVRGNYTGTLNAAGVTLNGTQVWIRKTSGGAVTRTCKGTAFPVELSRQ